MKLHAEYDAVATLCGLFKGPHVLTTSDAREINCGNCNRINTRHLSKQLCGCVPMKGGDARRERPR